MGAREHEGGVEAVQELHVVSSVLGRTLPLCGSLANFPAAAPSSSVDEDSIRGQEYQGLRPPSSSRGAIGLSPMHIEAVLKACSTSLGPTPAEEVIFGYKRVQGGFEGPSVGKEAAKEDSDVLNKPRKIPTASPASSVKC